MYLPTALQDGSVFTNRAARQICTYQQSCKTNLYLPTALQDRCVLTNSGAKRSQKNHQSQLHVVKRTPRARTYTASYIVSSGRRKKTNNHLCQFKIKLPGDIHWPDLNLPVSHTLRLFTESGLCTEFAQRTLLPGQKNCRDTVFLRVHITIWNDILSCAL